MLISVIFHAEIMKFSHTNLAVMTGRHSLSKDERARAIFDE